MEISTDLLHEAVWQVVKFLRLARVEAVSQMLWQYGGCQAGCMERDDDISVHPHVSVQQWVTRY